ncbi:MAG: four helix bundle protein [Candidatus Levyibacteriota bacterium]
MEDKKKFKIEFKKRCFNFSVSILRFSEKTRSKQINWPLLDQLVRSATSIGANVVEGGNSTSRKEFINYFQIALKSSSESLYWLALMGEINPDNKDTDGLIQECTELKKMITTIILDTKNNSRF